MPPPLISYILRAPGHILRIQGYNTNFVWGHRLRHRRRRFVQALSLGSRDYVILVVDIWRNLCGETRNRTWSSFVFSMPASAWPLTSHEFWNPMFVTDVRQHMRLERRLPILRYWRGHGGNGWNDFRFLAVCYCEHHIGYLSAIHVGFEPDIRTAVDMESPHRIAKQYVFGASLWRQSLVPAKAPYVRNSVTSENRLLSPECSAKDRCR